MSQHGQPDPFSRDGAADAAPDQPQEWPGYGASAPEPTRPYEPGYDSPTPDPYAGYPPNPYESNPYAPSPYAASPYSTSPYPASPFSGGYVAPYGTPPVPHPSAVTALVLGLVGMFCWPVGIGGIVVGHRVRRGVDAEPARYSGRGMGTAGFVLGIVEVVFLALFVFFMIIGFAAAVGSS